MKNIIILAVAVIMLKSARAQDFIHADFNQRNFIATLSADDDRIDIAIRAQNLCEYLMNTSDAIYLSYELIDSSIRSQSLTEGAYLVYDQKLEKINSYSQETQLFESIRCDLM